MSLQPCFQLLRHLTPLLLNLDLLLISDFKLVYSCAQHIRLKLFVFEVYHIIDEHVGQYNLIHQILIVHSLQPRLKVLVHLQLVRISLHRYLFRHLFALLLQFFQ